MATTLTSTTLAAAVTADADQITVASGTGFSAGKFVYLSRFHEMMKLVSQGSAATIWNVIRGVQGKAIAHASGDPVYVGAGSEFASAVPAGVQDDATVQYLPAIVPRLKAIATVINDVWQTLVQGGLASGLAPGSYQTYTADGAINLVPGVHVLVKGSAAAMTLAAPGPLTPAGSILTIIAGDASANTVTFSVGGFVAANTIATMGGAIGDSLTVQNQGGAWKHISSRNMTPSGP